MNFENPTAVSITLLKQFIYEAKRRSFAFTDNKTSLSDQTSVYSYRPFAKAEYAGMIYTDMYGGNTIEGGQESVSIDLILRWRNQYYGGTKASFWDVSANQSDLKSSDPVLFEIGPRFPEVVSSFLKSALMNMSKDFPVRGPKEFSSKVVEFEDYKINGDWIYRNKWKGVSLFNNEDPFTSYIGEEHIFYNGIEVYWHGYHGGLVRDKYFPSIVN